jgi:drug/metabolite transporter (DMT)-like permease
MNLMLTIVFGVVGLVLSFGFSVPPEPSTFRLIAAAGVMVGFQLGQLAGRFVRPRPKRFLALFVSALFFVYFAFAYVQTLQLGSANTSDIVNLGVLLGLSFFWLGFLLPFTRVPNAIGSLWSKG